HIVANVRSATQTWIPGTRPGMTVVEPLIRHRHGAQRLSLARRQLFGLRLQLSAGGEDVATARGAHRRGISGVEDIFGERFDLVPVRTFVTRARPGIEG